MAYNNQQADPVSAVLIALVECIFALFRGVGWIIALLWRLHRTAAARRRIEMAMEAAEAQRQEQAAQQFNTVREQMARGTSGNASAAEADAALAGRGGRPSDLDERWF